MAISRNNTITVSLFSTLKRKKRKFYNQHLAFSKYPRKLIKIYPVYQIYTDYSFAPRSWLANFNICIKRVLSRYMCTFMYIYMYYISLCSQKCKYRTQWTAFITPSNWHWTSINTQFTDHVTAFRRRCLLMIRCPSISWLHAYSVAESTGLAPSRGYPWRWPRITSQMCTLGRLACNWEGFSRTVK